MVCEQQTIIAQCCTNHDVRSSLSNHISSPVLCFCQVECSFIHKDKRMWSSAGFHLHYSITEQTSYLDTLIPEFFHLFLSKMTVYNCFILILCFSSTLAVVVVLTIVRFPKVLLWVSTQSRIVLHCWQLPCQQWHSPTDSASPSSLGQPFSFKI